MLDLLEFLSKIIYGFENFIWSEVVSLTKLYLSVG